MNTTAYHTPNQRGTRFPKRHGYGNGTSPGKNSRDSFSPSGRDPDSVGREGLTFGSDDLRYLLTSFVNHKAKMIEHLGYTTHRMGQLKAITTIKLRLAHVPLHDTQRMLNAYHVLRDEINELLPGTHSRYARQRDLIIEVLEYARVHNTVKDVPVWI